MRPAISTSRSASDGRAYCEPTRKQLRDWKRWVRSRPEIVRKLCERFEPWTLYRLKTTGHRAIVTAFNEDGTVTIAITGQFNLVLHDRLVFGIDPDDLMPCEPPGPSEHVGALLSPEEVAENHDALRVMVRPDLWMMGEDGQARRKH